VGLNAKRENSVNFSFNGSANYQSLFGFLTDLEKMRRPIKILTLNFRTSSTESGETLNLSISGNKPYLVPKNKI